MHVLGAKTQTKSPTQGQRGGCSPWLESLGGGNGGEVWGQSPEGLKRQAKKAALASKRKSGVISPSQDSRSLKAGTGQRAALVTYAAHLQG